MFQIISNAIRLILTRGVNALALLGLTVVISRKLGPHLFGDFSFMNAIVLTGIVIAGYGLDTFLVREVSRDRKSGQALLSTVLSFKILSSLAVFSVSVVIFGYVFKSENLTRYIWLFSTVIFLNSISQTFWYYSDAFDNFRLHSVLWAASNVLKVVIVWVFLLVQISLSAAIFAIIFAEFVTMTVSYWATSAKYRLKLHFVAFGAVTRLFRRCFPMALIFGLSAIYFRIGIMMLELMDGKYAVGQYAAAFKMVELLSIVPHTVCLAAFPSLSVNFVDDMDEFFRNSSKILMFLGISGLFLSLLLYVFAGSVINLIYGSAYTEAVDALKIFAWIVLLLFVNGYFAYLNLAGNLEMFVASVIVSATVLHVFLNFHLIPQYSHVGAAYAALFSEILMLTLYLGHFIVRKRNKGTLGGGHVVKRNNTGVF